MRPILRVVILWSAIALTAVSQTPSSDFPADSPVVFTTHQDHQYMLQQLGITRLRLGRDADQNSPRRLGPGANNDSNAQPVGAGLTRGIIGLTNLGQPRTSEQWGALRAWGWGASKGLGYLETVPEVDAPRVGIAGVSRFGKAALVALAFDQRFCCWVDCVVR